MKRLAILGVGLIGGSLALALKKAAAVSQVVGWSRREQTLNRALELGVIDQAETEISEALRGAELVVAAVPVGAMEALFRQVAPHLEQESIITDAGSTKGSVVEAARRAFDGLPPGFVPGHPIAGIEQSGVEAAFPELYQGRRVILTPTPESDPAAVGRVRAMWELCGAEVMEMEVAHHDEVLAATSHLPHLLAYSLVDTLARMDESEEIFQFAAGGFRDFTRIASSDPQMWHDICLANRDALLVMLERFSGDLAQMSDAIRSGDGEYLKQVFIRAKQARDRFCG
ncbi:MAG TPA: prephenate dehydrogenase/arogenate dehydrogenase family protein [Gammaproteobacteria bacterium]|nr:prephenate dehydrogenase/arogenate dehydrogenase family protein [Gammaproteobacteria bacterium]